MDQTLLFCFALFAVSNNFIVQATTTQGEVEISPQFLPLAGPVTSTSYYSLSPFYRNEKKIINRMQWLIYLNREEDALKLMRRVIANEKRWRHRLCFQLFGQASCSGNGNSAEPFFMWKKKLIHDLKVDPTQEIINQISKHIEF